MAEISISIEKKYILGWAHHNSTYTTTSRHDFMLFYAFKMAVTIAFLCENAVEAI